VLTAPQQGVAADEVALVQLDRPAQPRLERVDLLAQLVAVQRHGGLQAQRVARTEAARPGAAPDQFLPPGPALIGGAAQLDALLAGVAGAADDAAGAAVGRRLGVVVGELARVGRGQAGAQLDSPGPLDSDHAGARRAVVDRHVAAALVAGQPLDDLAAVGGV